MARIPKFPQLQLVKRIYRQAIKDESKVIKLWPNAKEHKKKVVSKLGFTSIAARCIKKAGQERHVPPKELKERIERYRIAHQQVIKEALPNLFNHRPSEFILANLHESWMPYAELLLKAAVVLEGYDFGDLKPRLKNLGFDEQILNLFRNNQKRKYFLQQTPASIATMIVSRRHSRRIGSEEAVRAAHKRLYSRVRRQLTSED